jgi:UDP-3-O-[3-hydroxymyristoyl] glucosamine N-acyltransferase
MIAAQSGLMLDTEENAKLGGSPAMPLKKWHRMNIMLQRMLDRKQSGDGGANGA